MMIFVYLTLVAALGFFAWGIAFGLGLAGEATHTWINPAMACGGLYLIASLVLFRLEGNDVD